MIRGFFEITAEDPLAQVWKLIRLYLDVPSVAELIRQTHNIADGKHSKQIKKQAIQTGYCIRQAEEYFSSATRAGLSTRPTLLYYGGVSLSRALVLLKKDGTYSFDALRKAERHNHHGLDLTRGLLDHLPRRPTLEQFFSALQCRIHPHETPPHEPWGHFPLFYECLLAPSFRVSLTTTEKGKPGGLATTATYPSSAKLPISDIASKPLDAYTLLKCLPDLYHQFAALNRKSDLARGSATASRRLALTTTPDGGQEITASEEHSFYIDGVSQEEKRLLLNYYEEKNNLIRLVNDFGSNLSLILKVVYQLPHNSYNAHYFPYALAELGYYPDVTENIAGEKFYIIHPDSHIIEPATHLIIMYCLGMLSRYYPDVWLSVIDENVEIAELTDAFLNIFARKFPNFILDQLESRQHYIHH